MRKGCVAGLLSGVAFLCCLSGRAHTYISAASSEVRDLLTNPGVNLWPLCLSHSLE